MTNYHKPFKTKTSGTGGKRKKNKDKKLRYFGSAPTNTKIGAKDVRKSVSIRGNRRKAVIKAAQYINLRGKDGKVKKVALRTVIETPDNRHHARQNILTKGAIVDTESGKAKITNRVGQDGIVNGMLI